MTKVLLSIVFSLAAFAAQAASLDVSGAWLRLLPGGLPAAGYFTLHNATGKTVVLTGADSAGCREIMLHLSSTGGGMTQMNDVQTVPVAPGKDLVFAPGGYHLMCMTPSMTIGAHVPVTLHFSGGATLSASFAVRGATGR